MGRALFPRTHTNILDIGIPDEIRLLVTVASEHLITSFLREIRETVQRIYVERSEQRGKLYSLHFYLFKIKLINKS